MLQPHLHFRLNTWLQWIRQRQLHFNKTRNINVLGFGVTYIRGLTVPILHQLHHMILVQLVSSSQLWCTCLIKFVPLHSLSTCSYITCTNKSSCMVINICIECSAIYNCQYSPKYSQQTPHRSPVRVKYGVFLWVHNLVFVLPWWVHCCIQNWVHVPSNL